MYFNPQIKERAEDFFNFEVLKQKLGEAIDDKAIPLIAVYGIRRTGKTSLIRVVLNSRKNKYIWLDGRDIASRQDFYEKISEQLSQHRRFNIKTFTFKGLAISVEERKSLDYISKKGFVLVIDEAQLLKRINLDKILAYLYDNYHGIKMIVSGSETGMLMNFLGKGNANAPLYGRAIYDILTQRLEPESSRLFLREGAKQAKKIFKDDEIFDAVDKIDGIIGWLTKYGWYRLKLSHKEALRRTIEEGKLVVKEELLRFISRSEGRYLRILRSAKRGATWEEIKNDLRISDHQLHLMLKRLVDNGYLEKMEKHYIIVDPLLAAAL